jgi:hypothetical protein
MIAESESLQDSQFTGYIVGEQDDISLPVDEFVKFRGKLSDLRFLSLAEFLHSL